MASNVKIKRSTVSGKVPLTTALQLGELAVNTYDGKLYLKKNDGTDQIVEVGASQASGITYSAKSANYNLVANDGILADTSVASFTLYLPASPTVGEQLFIADAKGTWSTNNLTIARNGNTIKDIAQDLICDMNNVNVQLIYNGLTWKVYVQAGVTGSGIVSTEFNPFLLAGM